jgi:hypothetical protein
MAATPQTPTPPTPDPESRTPTIVLAVVSTIVFAAVIVLGVVFVARGILSPGQGRPASATSAPLSGLGDPNPPSTAPDASAPHFGYLTAQTQVQCPSSGDAPGLALEWETSGATEVWFTAGDTDAVAAAAIGAAVQLPLAGNEDDLPVPFPFPCGAEEVQEYTITLLGDDGTHVSDLITVTDLNWSGRRDDQG